MYMLSNKYSVSKNDSLWYVVHSPPTCSPVGSPARSSAPEPPSYLYRFSWPDLAHDF